MPSLTTGLQNTLSRCELPLSTLVHPRNLVNICHIVGNRCVRLFHLFFYQITSCNPNVHRKWSSCCSLVPMVEHFEENLKIPEKTWMFCPCRSINRYSLEGIHFAAVLIRTPINLLSDLGICKLPIH